MFVNFSNHPSKEWNENQLEAAEHYGEIVDLPFPRVPATATEHDIDLLAHQYVQRILNLKPDCVLCQGEFCLAYSVITLLKSRCIKTVAACSERDTVELHEGSAVKKISNFTFIKFREY